MHKKKYDSLIILIPSFNELNNLKKFIKEIHKRYKVLIIDDCSSDNTSTWLKKNKINFIKNKKNIGYEQSLIKGLKILSKVKKVKKIITVEENVLSGGFGSSILEFCNENLKEHMCKISRIGLKDEFVDDYGDQNSLLNKYHINQQTLCKKMISLIKE